LRKTNMFFMCDSYTESRARYFLIVLNMDIKYLSNRQLC
jgi:hypothetical protein